MASPRPPPPLPSLSATPLDLEITVVSAKHLKNVNWRHGDLKPYAVAYLDPDRRSATKPDDSNSTKPVWNERLSIPLPLTHDLSPLLLTLIVFHSKPSEITKSPLIGTSVVPLDDLISVEPGAAAVKVLELRRPSGRPQGKLRIKIAIRERPLPPPLESNYQLPPPSSYYYSSAPLPPPPSIRDYRTYTPPPPVPQYNPPNLPPSSNYPYGNYADPYYSSSNNAGYYYSASPIPVSAPAPARTYTDPASGYHCGPSAPVEYSSGSSIYEQKGKGRKFGVGGGLAVGAVTGALGGLTLEEGLKYEEERIKERVESDHAARDDYSDYRSDY